PYQRFKQIRVAHDAVAIECLNQFLQVTVTRSKRIKWSDIRIKVEPLAHIRFNVCRDSGGQCSIEDLNAKTFFVSCRHPKKDVLTFAANEFDNLTPITGMQNLTR